jgi:hypothetical protein
MVETDELVEFDIEEEVSFDTIAQPNALEAFYEKKFYFSYSGLKKLLYFPPAFYEQYILNQREDKITKNLINGKVIHCLLLQPDKFNEQFLISPSKVPEGNNLKVVNAIFRYHLMSSGSITNELKDYPDVIIDTLIDINLHQSLKTNQQRLDKIISDDNSAYFNFLKIRRDKNVIDEAQLDYCKKAAEVISNNPEMRLLMGLDVTDFSSNEVKNEEHLRMDLKDYPFGIHGILDNVNVDHPNKVIYVNDLKTTGKELKEFKEAIKMFDYDLQAIMYLQLIGFKYQELIYKLGYRVEFRFITIDKNLQAYAFKVSPGTLSAWLTKLNETLVKANHHYTERRYELPYEFDRGLIVL